MTRRKDVGVVIAAARKWAAAERRLRDVNYRRHTPEPEEWHRITLASDYTEEELLAAVARVFPEDVAPKPPRPGPGKGRKGR